MCSLKCTLPQFNKEQDGAAKITWSSDSIQDSVGKYYTVAALIVVLIDQVT